MKTKRRARSDTRRINFMFREVGFIMPYYNSGHEVIKLDSRKNIDAAILSSRKKR